MFNKDNIIAGIGSVVDLFGTRSSNQYRNSSDEHKASSDYDALKSDWIAIRKRYFTDHGIVCATSQGMP